jgi:hypothetical protein
VPQWWQNLAPGLKSAAHEAHVAPASGAPQFAQYLPVATAPHDGQAAMESDEGGGDVMRLKLVRRRLVCSEIQSGSGTATATYDYRPAAVGGSAVGFGRADDAHDLAKGVCAGVNACFSPRSIISAHEQPARSKEPVGRQPPAGSRKLQLKLGRASPGTWGAASNRLRQKAPARRRPFELPPSYRLPPMSASPPGRSDRRASPRRER